MNFEDAKNLANECMEKAKSILIRDGFLSAMLFAINGEKVTPVLLNVNNTQEKDDAAALMKELSQASDYIIMLMDTYIRPMEKRDDVNSLPPSLKDDPESMEAVAGFLYSKDKTLIRYMAYKKKDDDGYCFFDQGWIESDSDSNGRFQNPFRN